jgi:hypothetical protein
MTTQRQMLGFDDPGAKKVPVSVRDWNGLKLALWRSKVSWEIVKLAATDILSRCQHAEGCLAEKNETEPCLRTCPDREVRMSALVTLNAARTCSPATAVKPAEHYFAPSREYFSEVLTELETTKLENEVMHEMLRQAGIVMPSPVEELTPKELVSTTSSELEEKSP